MSDVDQVTRYRTRILPRDEYARLAGTEAESLWPLMRPEDGHIVVVERDGAIVGCWALLRVVHAECVWVAPAERGNPVVAKRLLRGMREQAKQMGAHSVYTGATTDDVKRLLSKLGARPLEGDHYMLPLRITGDE